MIATSNLNEGVNGGKRGEAPTQKHRGAAKNVKLTYVLASFLRRKKNIFTGG